MSLDTSFRDMTHIHEVNDSFSMIFGNGRGCKRLMADSSTGHYARERAREAGMSLDYIESSKLHKKCGRCGCTTILVEHWSCGSVREGGGYRGQGIVICEGCDAEWCRSWASTSIAFCD
jgi:hypothetical protein